MDLDKDNQKILLEALIEKICRDKPHIGNLLESLNNYLLI